MFEPRSVAVHIGGQSGRTDVTHAMQIINRVRFYSRRNGRRRGWCYYVLTVMSEATWAARGHRESRASLAALIKPSARPLQLGCSPGILPM